VTKIERIPACATFVAKFAFGTARNATIRTESQVFIDEPCSKTMWSSSE